MTQSRDWKTWNGYAPYVIKEYDGVKVAVMGIGNPNIANWDVPENWKGIYFAGVVETYKHYEAEMKAQGRPHRSSSATAASTAIPRTPTSSVSLFPPPTPSTSFSPVMSTATVSPRSQTPTARRSPSSPRAPRQPSSAAHCSPTISPPASTPLRLQMRP